MLFIGWPLGTTSTTIAQAHFYIRDPQGAFGSEYRDRLVLEATLPADARPTGYRLGSIALYLSPGDQDEAIYVVAPSGAKRWPRLAPAARLCA